MKKKVKSRVRAINLATAATSVNRNTLVAGAAALIILTAAAFYFTQPQQPNNGATGYGSTSFEEFVEKASRERFWNNPDRSTYGIPLEIFTSLPPMPSDFGAIDYMMESGSFFAIGKLGEEYYKQPEFYPLFENSLHFWQSPHFASWGTNGYGSYPGDQWTTVSPGTTFEAHTFFYSSWNIQKWQGVRLVPVYSGSDVSASEIAKYFDVEISPDLFLLDPTFPAFGNNWAEKVTVTVHVKENAAPGRYIIGIDVVTPPKEVIEEWAWEHKNYYNNARGMISMGRPPLELTVTVS